MLKDSILRLLFCACLTSAVTALAETHKLRVTDPAIAKSLIARGGKLVADYDSFQLIEVDDSAARATDGAAESADQFNVIELNARQLDTRQPEIRALRKSVGGFAGRRLHLIHFAGPVKPEWLATLESHGVKIVSYIPQNAYLIYGNAGAISRMQSWAQSAGFVQWEGDYADEYKIHPRAKLTDEKGLPQKSGTDVFAVQLVDDAAANPATLSLINRLGLGPVKRQFRSREFLNVIVPLPPEQLALLATQPEVVSIQPYYQNQKLDERQDQIIAGNLTVDQPSGPGYLAWLAGKGFTQAQFTNSDFVVDVSDSGIDNGTTTPGHFGLYQLGNPTLPSRVVYNRLEGSPNGGSTMSGCDGHGNLNSHVIAGYNNLAAGFPHADSEAYHYGLGVCPFVKVGSSVIFDPSSFTDPDFENLQSEAYHDKARISANSWGANSAGAYNVDSQAYDALVRDAQPTGSTFATASNQQMVIVFAAGNAGPGAQTMNSPGSAKNVLTVGASENVRSASSANGGNTSTGDTRCSDDSDLAANSANDMADFSSRGPCADGRMKPDIVAPGTHITGGVGQSGAATTNGTGTALACFTADGVCALPGGGGSGNAANFFPLSQQFYTISSGTSHSTPAVAGACALLRQYFINNSLTPPSPAMTKAFLINSARYLNGAGANDTLWSAAQGMGELNLGVAFDGAARILSDQEPTNKFTATGQTRTFTGTIADSSKPFRVTLAWTDAPGSTSGNAFNNDLDLVVTVGGTTYKGNVFSGAFSTTGGAADNKNNVESVFLPAGASGTFSVTVSAANIVSDGVPNESPGLDQDFALVIYPATAGSVPVIGADSFTVTAENCNPTNGAVDPGETVTVRFALKNTGLSNTTNLVATLLETNGVTAPSGPQSYGALLAGGGAVTQAFSFTAVGPCGGFINPTFSLQDGASVLGKVALAIDLGQNATIITQNFDGVTAPAFPSGWTTFTTGSQPIWTNQTSVRDTLPNAMFSAEAGNSGANALVSPSMVMPAGQNFLTFRNSYNLEAPPSGGTGYDGAVLEIKIGAGAFADIITAGGSFVTGGYNRTISSSFGNPLAGRQAWSGNSGGFITTTVSLPPSASGQTIQLRWRCGTDSSIGGSGWRVDTVNISGHVCCAATLAELAVGETPSPVVVNLGSNLLSTITVTNLGPNNANAVVLSNTLPAGLNFLSATSSQGTCTNYGGIVVCSLGTVTNGTIASVQIHALAVTAGDWTNVAVVSSTTLDPVPGNNTVLGSISVNSPPAISGIPAQVTDEDTPVGPIAFTIDDAETPPNSLVLTGGSSDTNLVPVTGIAFGGSGTNVTVTLTPATNRNGVCTITITVSDGMASASNSFSLTVNPVNDPPSLAPIPDLFITEGQTLRYTNVVFDPEVPPQVLTYSLIGGPPGADVNPTNGIFTWTPAEDQGPSTNFMTIMVVDDGSPPLEDDKSFTVVVLESNQPPVLEPVKDRTIHVGSTVLITNVVTDPDIPANTLSFSLNTNSPPGAIVDSSTGIFQWTPDETFLDTSNSFTVTVTDNGLPPLSDAKSFVITVISPPLIQSITRSNDVVMLTWSSINGQNYRVQYRDDLGDPDWNDLPPDVTASGPTANKTDLITASVQRFYRITVLP